MKIAVLPGDDIGPEITATALDVLRAADAAFALGLEFEPHVVGMARHRTDGTTLPDSVIEAARAADGVLMGPSGITLYPPVEQGGRNIPANIRKHLDLFANIRPFRSRPGVPDARPGLDVVLVRENTEGFYADRTMFRGIGEFMPTPELALSVRKITAGASRRIARAACRIASRRQGRVTAIGKEHVLKLTDGLFMAEAKKVAAEEFPDIEFTDMDVDAFAAEIYSHPTRFDVVLTTNMFGDILSNLGAALSGGLGLAAALNAGETNAAANAGHGSAPDIAGKDVANPTGLILSTAMLLDWYGIQSGNEAFNRAAEAINAAVDHALADPARRTRDLGGSLGTRAYGAMVAEGVASRP